MFIHLGKNVVIPSTQVVAIMDMSTADFSKETREFLSVSEKEGFINDISDGNKKSFVVTDRLIYISAISSTTLQRRAGFVGNL